MTTAIALVMMAAVIAVQHRNHQASWDALIAVLKAAAAAEEEELGS